MYGITMMEYNASNVFCDNESVMKTFTRLKYVLNEKHSLI